MNNHTLQPSSTVFSEYARYYDLLYKDKNYVGESEYIHGLIHRSCPDAKTILELGSGTGKHALLLAQKGYRVQGVERSAEMLVQARALSQAQRSQLTAAQHTPPVFVEGDIRSVRVAQTFDVALSLFHVISYQTTNADLQQAFETARHHVKPGGLFIFDVWYGPTVLTDRPAVRVKHMADDQIEVTRIAEPVLHPNQNVVDVHYHVFIRNKATGTVNETHEKHAMRYLFTPEITLLLDQSGFSLLHQEEWLTARPPGCDTWGVCFVARRAGEKAEMLKDG
jgi:SAM-dependent methyltransferase